MGGTTHCYLVCGKHWSVSVSVSLSVSVSPSLPPNVLSVWFQCWF